MTKIHVLDSHVADLIAAGEVVERPASVVKELLENAIDAGASAITVEIRNGGISYIRVTDNGAGIPRADAPTAFLRHATSKISKQTDLERIHTLGFRGEALAAISAVSKIDLLTKHENEENGCTLRLEAGKLISDNIAGCPKGTTIVVRELFYNTPARMKFLRKDSAEGAAVEGVVACAAISHPEVSIKLIREEKELLHTPGDNILKSAIYSVYGREFTNGILETDYENKGVRVYGFSSLPAFARGNRSMQFFYVNQRPVKSRMLSAVLDEAYKDKLMKGRFPSCVLFIDIPSELVDVNIHPAKTEVKFANERDVSGTVYFAVKSSLENDVGIIEATLKSDTKTAVNSRPITPQPAQSPVPIQQSFLKPELFQGGFAEVPAKYDDGLRKIKQESEIKRESQENPKERNEEKAPTQVISRTEPQKPVENEKTIAEEQLADNARVLGEVMKTYIIAEHDDKLLIIDKHAAHERIIFKRLKDNMDEPQGQLFLSPLVIKLTPVEMNIIIENKHEIESLGFGLGAFGENEIIVRQAPIGIEEDDVLPIITVMASSLLKGVGAGRIEKLDAIINSVACKAALKAGMKNDISELKSLANTVLYDSEIRYCPHGRPIVFEISRKQLEKQFKRIL